MIQIGKVVNTVGLKGELKFLVNPLYLDLSLKKNTVVKINNQEFIILRYRSSGNLWYVTFKDKFDVNLVEYLKGELFYIDEVYFNKPEKGYYRFQLRDFEVFDQNNRLIGIIKEVESTGFQDLIRIKTTTKDVLIPMVPAFIKDINFVDRQVIVNMIEGLV